MTLLEKITAKFKDVKWGKFKQPAKILETFKEEFDELEKSKLPQDNEYIYYVESKQFRRAIEDIRIIHDELNPSFTSENDNAFLYDTSEVLGYIHSYDIDIEGMLGCPIKHSNLLNSTYLEIQI